MEEQRDEHDVDLTALAAKLDALDLTDAEHELMLSVFAAAADTMVGEVSGFSINPCIKLGVNPCGKLGINPCLRLGINPCNKVGRGPLSQGFLNSFGIQG